MHREKRTDFQAPTRNTYFNICSIVVLVLKTALIPNPLQTRLLLITKYDLTESYFHGYERLNAVFNVGYTDFSVLQIVNDMIDPCNVLCVNGDLYTMSRPRTP